MTTFTAGQHVKLKDSVAEDLEGTIGTWDNEFRILRGIVGTLETSIFSDRGYWRFIAPGKWFVVAESEIEAVQE